jgi:hypothetical protein
MGLSRANGNRKIRQDALREQLAGQGHVQQVIVNIEKIEAQGASMEAQELNALKIANDQRLKLVNKYLPDLKATEITGEAGAPISVADMSTWSEEQLDAYISSHQ